MRRTRKLWLEMLALVLALVALAVPSVPALADDGEVVEQLSLGVRTDVTDVDYSRYWTGAFTVPAEGSYVFVTGMYNGEGGPTNDSAYLYADSAFTQTINVGHVFSNEGHGVEVSADLEAGQTVYLRTWVTHDQGIAVVRLARVTTSQAKYLATGGSDTPAVVVRYDDGAVLEEGTDYELEWWDCGADGDYQLLERVPSKTGNYMVKAVGSYGVMLGDAFFSIVDPARLALGLSVHAYTYDGGSDWLGMFTAPAPGTYTFVSMGSEDVIGPVSLYADLTLNEPLARDDSRSLDGSNFKVCCDLAEDQTVYLVLEAYGDSCYVAVGEGSNFAGYTLINNMSITVGTDTFVADGRGHTPQDVIIRDAQGAQLIQGTDYAVASYYNVDTGDTLDSMPVDPGYYRVLYEGKGAYVGALGVYFEIQDPYDLSYATMTMASDDRSNVATYLVDGKPRVPQVSVVDLAGRTLKLGLDYVLQYHTYGTDWTLEAPSESGTYWFVEAVPAEGSDYVGSCEPDRDLGAERFDIVEPRELVVGTTEDIVFEHGVAAFTAPVSDVYTFAVGHLYEGDEVQLWSTYACPGFSNSIGALQGRRTSKTLRLEEGQVVYLTGWDKDAVVKVAEQTWTGKPLTPAPTVMLGGATLTEETDNTVSYQANIDPGTATVTVTGKGLYTGTKSADFIVSCPASKLSVTSKAKTYTGKQLLPTVVVELGSTKLVQGTDYSVSYKDKTGKKVVAASNVKTAGTYTVVITGKGSYSGTKTITYTIKKAANPMKAAAKTKKAIVKQATLAKKAQAVQVVKLTKAAQGSVTYKNVSKKTAVKKWRVSSKGVVSVPKGTKKGTYALKLVVTAKGNANYQASKAQAVTVTVVVN